MRFKDDFVPAGGFEEKIERFYEELIDYNRKVNLTSVTERKDFFIKHVWDSLAGQKYFKEGAAVAEVGSGGGFPSLPLKLARPDLKFTLMESVNKKCRFLEEVCKKLGLDGMAVLNDRAENAARGELREKFDVCCARAVARLNTLLEYCVPLLRCGGTFVAYKGEADEEIAEAQKAAALLGAELVCAEKYELPEGEGARTLAVYRKIRPTPAGFPRGQGKERKFPL